jgi:hypothetical protein
MMHFVEEDLSWFDLGIPGMVLAWETEVFLAKWADDHEKFDRWLAEHPEQRFEQGR